MKFNRKEFGLRLKSAREEYAGITQKELAEKTGISDTVISSYEHGKRIPSLEHFAAIVLALETNCEYMLQIDEFDLEPEPSRIT